MSKEQTPKRVQRKRVQGWRMPPNTVSVTRPGKYGNPYQVKYYTRDEALTRYRAYLRGRLDSDPHFLDDLKGKDLMCWCSLTENCHADIILQFLKEEES